MAINTLTDLNNLITNGSGAERIAFKNIIVGGLNAQDLADIVTASTRPQKEALALLVIEADDFLKDTQKTVADAQLVIDLATAQTWYDTNIVPQLVWNISQSLIDQRANILLDYNLIEATLVTETDTFRRVILNGQLSAANSQFKAIKAAL